jgi:potassium efflux system protein
MSAPVLAAETSPNVFYSDRTKMIAQQTTLLKNRLLQAQAQLSTLQHQEELQLSDLSLSQPNKQLRSQAALDIAVAKSNVDSINIELSESQQTINRLEKDIQEIEDQLNVFSIFGLKIARSEALNVGGLQAELTYQKNVLQLEKTRAGYLLNLQQLADNILQLQKAKFSRINLLLKSRTILALKERQAQSEVDFQQQQSYWLQQLNTLYAHLNQVEAAKHKDKKSYANLQRDIFYANENLNFAYLQMLIVRYQDQLQQLKIAVSHSTSVAVLNKASDQIDLLKKQLGRVNSLLKTRMTILDKRKTFLSQYKDDSEEGRAELARLIKVGTSYQAIAEHVSQVDKKLMAFRTTLDQSLQVELSSRQGLPGFSQKAWVDLGAEIRAVPTLTYQVAKSLSIAAVNVLHNMSYTLGLIIGLLEIAIIALFLLANSALANRIGHMAEYEWGHLNLKRLGTQLLQRNLLDLIVISNIAALFYFCNIPSQSAGLVINLALVWLFFKVLIIMARICLVETAHDRAGHDVRLYHRLKWTFLVGGVVTALTVFMHQLPMVYELQDLFDRLFLLCLLVASAFLLKSWEVVPALILPHIDNRRLYLKKIVSMLGFLIPLILLVNSAIGLFGFMNLVLTVCRYESIFVAVLVSYLVIRGLFIDGMMYLSTLFIRHTTNGWLWTEAFLKPLDQVLRVLLFCTAWVVLCLSYGLNQQSPIVTQLNALMHYHLVNMFNITLLSIVEITVITSFLFWSARWTREFVYRMLSARTKDMGLRNSVAIFSQYTVIVIGVFVCLQILGIDSRALTFLAGTFLFGAGLGLRDLVNNFACGFLLLIERPLRVGDTVTVNNYEGEVTHIGGRAVTVRTWDHMDVLVPNAEIFSKSFTNWTAKDHIVRTIIAVKVNRQDSPHDVQALIHQVLATHRDVLSDPAPEVLLKELNDGLIEFEIRYFVNLRQIKSRIGLRSEVLMAIWDAFEKHGIKPPYPHHEIFVKSGLQQIIPLMDEKILLASQTEG